MPWKRERLPTPVFWPGEFHGLHSPRGRKESDTTEQPSLQLSLHFTSSTFTHAGAPSSLIHHEVGRTITPISQVWKLRHRGEKCSEFLAGCREMSVLLNPASLRPEAELSTLRGLPSSAKREVMQD